MSLKAKITAAVNKAFNAVGDLVEKGKLSNTTASNYDFATRSTTTTSKTETVDVIILDTSKDAGVHHDTVKGIMKAGPTLDYYDTLTVNKVKYSIVSYQNNGYTVDLVLKKEA